MKTHWIEHVPTLLACPAKTCAHALTILNDAYLAKAPCNVLTLTLFHYLNLIKFVVTVSLTDRQTIIWVDVICNFTTL